MTRSPYRLLIDLAGGSLAVVVLLGLAAAVVLGAWDLVRWAWGLIR